MERIRPAGRILSKSADFASQLETPQFYHNQRTPTMKVTALALMLIVAPTDVMAGPFCKDSPMCRMCYDMHVL